MSANSNFSANNVAPSPMGSVSSSPLAGGNASPVVINQVPPQPVYTTSVNYSRNRKPRTAAAAKGAPRRYKTPINNSHSQVAAGTSSSPVPLTVPVVKSKSDNGKSSCDNRTPIFGGYYPLFDRETSLIKEAVIKNIPHTEGLDESGKRRFPENPHHISAEVRKCMVSSYVRVSGQLYACCASLYASSRDITVVKELKAQCSFSFLYGVYSAKDYYCRAPALRRDTIRSEDEKVDLSTLNKAQFWSKCQEFDSIYMGDVYDTHMGMSVGPLINAILAGPRVKEVVWFGHMMSTPFGIQGESGFYHYHDTTIFAYPHKDPTPSDMYVHPPPFVVNATILDLRCEAHSLGPMGVYVTFRKEGTTSIRDVLEQDRVRLGFKAGALWPFLENGLDNLDFYTYEKYAYQVISDFRYRAEVPRSTSLAMLQSTLLRLLGTDAVMKRAEAYPSAAKTRALIVKATFGFLCKLFNERMAELGDLPQLEELHLSPWWSQVAHAVSSRATIITSTAVAVIGAFRVLQVLRPATVGFNLLSSSIGLFPTYFYSVFGAPVLEDLIFSKICEYVPPYASMIIMALCDGISNMSVTSFVISFLIYYAKLWLLSRGVNHDEVDRLILGLHTSVNLFCFSVGFFENLWYIHPMLAVWCYLIALMFITCAAFLVIWYMLERREIPNNIHVWTVPYDKTGWYIDLANKRARDREYHVVEVTVPQKVNINGTETYTDQVLLRDSRVIMDSATREFVDIRINRMERMEDAMSARKVEYICKIPGMQPFKPPPKTMDAYAYAITKRILSQTPPEKVVLKSGFNSFLLSRIRSGYMEEPITVATEDNVDALFQEVISKLPPGRKADYNSWWKTLESPTRTQQVDFMNGQHWDPSMCMRVLMLKLDEGQEECKPRCLINAHVSLSIFYKRHFDQIHGGLKKEAVEHMRGREGEKLRTFTIFAAGLTHHSLCAQVNEAINKEWIGERVRIVICVAGDDTWLCILEKDMKNQIDTWYYETDATSFDASQGRSLLEEEIGLYESAGVPVEFLRKATFNKISVTVDKHSKINCPINFELDVTGRSTGFPNTSLGNSIVEALIVHECILEVYKVWCSGKRLFREVLDETDIYLNRAKEMGITFKKLYSGPVIERASFLRGFFYYSDSEELRWAPAIGRLAKLSKVLAELSVLYPKIKTTEALHKQYLYDVFYGLRTYDWPECMVWTQKMNDPPVNKLVSQGLERNPSSLISDENAGQAYSLEVLQRRYADLRVVDEDGLNSFETPFMSECSLEEVQDVLNAFYRYDYR